MLFMEIAGDLFHGCQMSGHSHYEDPAWDAKYMEMHRYKEKNTAEAGGTTR